MTGTFAPEAIKSGEARAWVRELVISYAYVSHISILFL